MRSSVLKDFDLDPDRIYLNHGAFGAVPRPVRKAQGRWRRRAEANPMRFNRVEVPALIAESRALATEFIGAAADSTALVRNVTEAMAMVLRTMRIGPGDDVLVSNHGYLTLGMSAETAGARVVTAPFAVDALDEQIVQAFAEGVTSRTRLVVVDQVTSPTARVLPVREIVQAVAPAPVMVDAAHVAGTLPDLDIDSLGAAFWSTNLHKWAFAPRATGLLWFAPQHRDAALPLVTSWNHGRPFPQPFDYPATGDHSAWLAAPAGLDYWRSKGGPALVRRNALLVEQGAQIVSDALGHGSDSTGSPGTPAPTMRLVRLPEGAVADAEAADRLYLRLSEEARIEVPPVFFEGAAYLRLSAQVYNEPDDYHRLADVLPTML